ncbi:hypothetical protein BCR34DRAFT_576565 [Clohesyomyces aquaticus]|uniref:Ribosomal protein L22/L17 n=1 Tax=Clohesyomyces aquaticus TaxID=1231657 RepID=A0A1Y1YNZ1_9PLEO|nr:hypothetical protein BCR34DRAFT_576565 [Clohesyomyces aquaticus]
MRARLPIRPLCRTTISAASRPAAPQFCPTRSFKSLAKVPSRAPRRIATKPTDSEDLILGTENSKLAFKALQNDPSNADADVEQPKNPEQTFPETSVFGTTDERTVEETQKAANENRWWQLARAQLDPAPRKRRLWERKKVIESLQRRGRITQDIKLARTERSSLYRSPELPTSTRKITKLMRQISGMTVEEALVQLRFSKKRVATDIIKGLLAARDHAIAARGMGIGLQRTVEPSPEDEAETPENKPEAEELSAEAKKAEAEAEAAGKTEKEMEAERKAAEAEAEAEGSRRFWEKLAREAREAKKNSPIEVELRNGKRRKVVDPTDIYIAQAWVGKGAVKEMSPDYRGRGKVYFLTHRSATFSVLLKEEKTRMRISDEIKKKRDHRKLWTALPDRPITSQRQFCLW